MVGNEDFEEREKKERVRREKEKRKSDFLGFSKLEFIALFSFSKRISFFAYFESCFRYLTNTTQKWTFESMF